MGWELAAILAAGLFAGAAVYISLVEHPARMQCGTEIAIAEFGPSYQRASLMQATLAAVGLLSATAAWLTGSGRSWLVGGIILGSVIPFTLIAIFPTNKALLDAALDARSQKASELLDRWARLHAVRSLLGVLAFLVFAWAR